MRVLVGIACAISILQPLSAAAATKKGLFNNVQVVHKAPPPPKVTSDKKPKNSGISFKAFQ